MAQVQRRLGRTTPDDETTYTKDPNAPSVYPDAPYRDGMPPEGGIVYTPSTPDEANPAGANDTHLAPEGPDAGYRTDFGGGNLAQQQRQIGDASRVAAPPGFDATKWANLGHTSDKYTAGRILAGSGGIDDVVHALQGWKKISNDVIEAPDGSQFDILFDVGGPQQRPQWLQVKGPGGSPMGPSPLERGTGAGMTFDSNAGNVGQDDFSKLIQGKLSELIGNNGYLNDNTEALQLENVRQAADRARKAEYEGALSQLANRGLLPENTPGGQGGLALDALSRIERNDIAPLFSNATRDYQIHRADVANNNLLSALEQGTGRQNVLSQIALQSLAQNMQFNEFLATFGLERDRTLHELAQGKNDALLNLFMMFLNANKTGNAGYVGKDS